MKTRNYIMILTALLMAALLQGCGAGAGMDGAGNTGDTLLSTSSDSGAAPTLTFTGFAIVQVDGALSGKVVAFFSEDMDPASINASNFTVRGPTGKLIPGDVLYIGVTAVFTPRNRFSADTYYVANMSSGVRSLSGVPMASARTWKFKTPDPSQLTGVLVSVGSTAPASYATDVPLNSGVNVTFRQVMDPATINSSTVTVFDHTGAKLAGQVHYSGLTASFVPSASLEPGTTYRVIVNTGAKSLGGINLDHDYKSLFTTSSTGATVPPQVVGTAPMLGDGGVSLNGVVIADFNEGMDTATISTGTFTVRDAGGNPVDGTVSYTGDIAVFTPDAPLQPQSVYTATVSTGAHSSGGIALADAYSWDFTTTAASSAVTPTVVFTSPSAWQSFVWTNTTVSVAFSAVIDPATLDAGTFQVKDQAGNPVTGSLSYLGNVATFTPDHYLAMGTEYTVTLTSGIRSIDGASLAPYSWNFTTTSAM